MEPSHILLLLVANPPGCLSGCDDLASHAPLKGDRISDREVDPAYQRWAGLPLLTVHRLPLLAMELH
eukprot:11939248-Alexandrium_andersonii.AAC.1